MQVKEQFFCLTSVNSLAKASDACNCYECYITSSNNGKYRYPHKGSDCISGVRGCRTIHTAMGCQAFRERGGVESLNFHPVNAEVVLKATNVDGVYDDDPKHNLNARLLETLTYQEVTSKDLLVMDMTAITLCQENSIPGM